MTGTPLLVLLIEDELPIRRFLRPAMEANGCRLLEAGTGKEGLLAAAERKPDVIVLDLGLPDMDGLAVIRALREWSAVPIIILSARGQEQDKIAGLDAGADDYVAKPFSVGELMARIRVAARHAAQPSAEEPETTVVAGNLRIDRLHRQVWRGDEEVRLTPIEYKLLTTLVRHAGLVLTQRQLLKEVWGPEYADQAHYLRIFVHQLRHKLEDNPSRPRHLITEAGIGYRFKLE